MNKKHIQTSFYRFIAEKYEGKKMIEDEEEEPIEEPIEKEEPIEEEEPKIESEDDDLVEEVLKEYKKVMKKYENSKLSNRRRK